MHVDLDESTIWKMIAENHIFCRLCGDKLNHKYIEEIEKNISIRVSIVRGNRALFCCRLFVVFSLECKCDDGRHVMMRSYVCVCAWVCQKERAWVCKVQMLPLFRLSSETEWYERIQKNKKERTTDEWTKWRWRRHTNTQASSYRFMTLQSRSTVRTEMKNVCTCINALSLSLSLSYSVSHSRRLFSLMFHCRFTICIATIMWISKQNRATEREKWKNSDCVFSVLPSLLTRTLAPGSYIGDNVCLSFSLLFHMLSTHTTILLSFPQIFHFVFIHFFYRFKLQIHGKMYQLKLTALRPVAQRNSLFYFEIRFQSTHTMRRCLFSLSFALFRWVFRVFSFFLFSIRLWIHWENVFYVSPTNQFRYWVIFNFQFDKWREIFNFEKIHTEKNERKT